MKIDSNKIIVIFAVIALIGILCGVAVGLSRKNKESTSNEYLYEAISDSASLKYIENIPSELTIDDAVNRKYFVYDGQNNKVYNKNILNSFIKNTAINSPNRISDEICIVIYSINGEPTIYDLLYDSKANKYIFAYDYTRVKTWEIPMEEKPNPDIYNQIITNDNILGEYYGIEVVEDTDFDVAIILLKAYNKEENKNYTDIEIARYMLDAKIVE